MCILANIHIYMYIRYTYIYVYYMEYVCVDCTHIHTYMYMRSMYVCVDSTGGGDCIYMCIGIFV